MGVFTEKNQRGVEKVVVSKQLPNGRRLRMRVPNRTLAKRILAGLEQAIYVGNWREYLQTLHFDRANSITLCDFSAKFINDYCKPRMRSWNRYQLAFQHLNEYLGMMDVREITRADLHWYIEVRTKEKSWSKDEIVNPATVNREIAALKKMFSYAVDLGLIIGHPLRNFRLLPIQERELRIPTPEEVEQLIDAASTPELRCLIAVAAETGLRRSELINLRWECVDFRNRLLTVARKTKSRRVRYVPLSEKALAYLQWLQDRGFSPWVFVHPDGGRIKSPDKSFRAARARLGLGWVTIHTLRHYRISQWVRHGLDIGTVKELAGHSNIQTTQRYMHFDPQQLEIVRRVQAKESEGNLKINLKAATKWRQQEDVPQFTFA